MKTIDIFKNRFFSIDFFETFGKIKKTFFIRNLGEGGLDK
jgi:hypothetical protein